ncbi:hypothetical protein GCM10010967_13740 [Dyadobacter beijingensis]|uniref:SnoaL-like domain-containing protein n=1 Tax=Dyadobacter beijingensis TaxID=365489 RepID=A0ABQ2HKK9_9BACT|nr:DUF6169 family protein [Dyadobacter beijingensis]GGM83266.1 hypothetical protein GCM10010967_13740 [Dyadobacter beijingensis]
MRQDIRLRNTVLDILNRFLTENDAIVIYYCDHRDGRGHARQAKFNRWFSIIQDTSIDKQDRQVTVVDLNVGENGELIRSELVVYASMLLRKTHPDYNAAIRIFHSGDSDKTGKL